MSKIHILNTQDINLFRELIRLFEEVFEWENFTMPPDAHLQKLLEKKNFLAFVAKKDGVVIGGMTAYILEQYSSEKPLAYIYDLAVAVSHQRQGIGKTLIKTINDYCTQNGFEEIYVQADRADDHALDFYRSTQPTAEEDVLHFSYHLK